MIEPVKTALPQRLAAAGWTDPQAVQFLGPSDVSETGAPPEVSWRPISADIAPPRGLRGTGTAGALYSRHVSVEFLIWGETLEQVEQIHVALVNALHSEFTVEGFELRGEEWAEIGESAHGVEMRLLVVMKGQILRDQWSRPIEGIGTLTFNLNGEE